MNTTIIIIAMVMLFATFGAGAVFGYLVGYEDGRNESESVDEHQHLGLGA